MSGGCKEVNVSVYPSFVVGILHFAISTTTLSSSFNEPLASAAWSTATVTKRDMGASRAHVDPERSRLWVVT